jgi:hypothetical protein
VTRHGRPTEMMTGFRLRLKVYGPEHPDVARDADNMGQILGAKGDLEGAQEQTERAPPILEKHCGANNPQTQTVRHAAA